MRRRLVLTYLTITAVVIAALAVPLGVTYADRQQERLVGSVERSAHDLAAALGPWIQGRRDLPAEELVERFEAAVGGRVVVVDAASRSVADSESGRGTGEDFSNRPEIVAALAGHVSSGVRASTTAGGELLYVAVPVRDALDVVGAVRVTFPRAALDDRVRSVWMRLVGLGVAVIGLVAAVGWFLARTVSEPVRQLEEAAGDMALGRLSTRVGAIGGPSEVRRLAAAFDGMADRVEAMVTSQRAFVADASHQLRTPLTALRLRLEAMEAGRSDAASVAAAVREVDRLSLLVDGLLAVARLEARSARPVAVDVAAAVTARAELWEPLLADEGVSLRVDLEPAVAEVIPDGLEQVLDNLLANALDQSAAGDEIAVAARRVGTDVEVHVVDQGPGLPSSDIERAFDRFWRSPSAKPGGTGLGLAIVAEIARSSGGDAAARPAPGGRGLDVFVRLPARP